MSTNSRDGDGALQTPVLYTVWAQEGTGYGNLLNTVVVSDLNNDGKPDLVVAGWGSIGVLLNQTPRAVTATTLVSQPNPSASGQAATFTSTVSSSAPGSPTGNVTFTEGTTTLGTAPLVNGVATLDVSSLALGSHTLVASYSSDSAFRASVSAPLTHVVEATTQITVDTSPSGLTIVVDGVSDTAPKTYQWTPNSQHQLSTTEPQQVTAGSRLMFSTWSDGGVFTHTVTTPSSPATYTATFKTQYLLTTVTTPPAGGSMTPGGWFDARSNVTITATPAPGYSFTGFSGDLSGTTNPNSVAMNAAETVTANFNKAPTSKPPKVTAPKNVKVEATGPAGAVVAFTASATDPQDGTVPVTCAPASGSVFPLGATTVTCSATNSVGKTDTDMAVITVRDTTDPTIVSVTPSVTVLPNTDQTVPVSVATVATDLVDAAPACQITRVTGGATDLDNDGVIDWAITGPLTLNVQSVARKHKDRTYTITVKCTDASGNTSKEKATIVVSRLP